VKNKETLKLKNTRLLRLLSDRVAIGVINVLKQGPSYTRELATILGVGESIVSRKLRDLERLGVVEAQWRRRDEKTVREYWLVACNIELCLSSMRIYLSLCDDNQG